MKAERDPAKTEPVVSKAPAHPSHGNPSEPYDYGKNPIEYENEPAPILTSLTPTTLGGIGDGKIKFMASHRCDDPDSKQKMQEVMQFIQTLYEVKPFKDVINKITKDNAQNKINVYFRQAAQNKLNLLGQKDADKSPDPEFMKNIKQVEAIIRFFEGQGFGNLNPAQFGDSAIHVAVIQESMKLGKDYLAKVAPRAPVDTTDVYHHDSLPEDQKRVAQWNSPARTVRVNLDHPQALEEDKGLGRVQGSLAFELVNASSTQALNEINRKKDAGGFEEEALAWNREHPGQPTTGRFLYARAIEFLEWKNAQIHHQMLVEAAAAGTQIPESANLFSEEFGALKEPKPIPEPGSEEEKLAFNTFFNFQLALGHAQGYMAYYDARLRPS